MADEPTDTQKTQPRPRKPSKKKPKPFDIPIPGKSQIMRDFEKIAASPTDDGSADADEE
jgi:hypothetical protein